MSVSSQRLALANEFYLNAPKFQKMSVEDIYDASFTQDADDPSNNTSVIMWPWVQDLFDQPGFRQNSALITSSDLYGQYGDSAYAVLDSWLQELGEDILSRALNGHAGSGPSFSQACPTGLDDGCLMTI